MGLYRIVCSTLQNATEHHHLVEVATGRNPLECAQRWTVEQVRAALDRGDVFYTSDTLGRMARVIKDDCVCGYPTIRSAADAWQGNDLDFVRQCRCG